MDPAYEPNTDEQRLGYLVEECGELVSAIGKSLWWGLNSVNPELPIEQQEQNWQWIEREIRDVEAAIARVRPVLERARQQGGM